MNIIDSTHLELRGKSKIAKHFKGHVRLDLCDPLTGKVKERVEGENTFTNALDSLINDTPYGLGKGIFNNVSINGSGDINVTPINDVALGGCLLFPAFTKPDDLDDFYEPMSNQPTAYATKLNVSEDVGVDTKLGTFNAVESGEIENGFRNVYDWTTSAGNGLIGAVALTSRRGGVRYCSDIDYMRMIAGYGYNKTITPSTGHIFGIGNGGVFIQDGYNNRNYVAYFKQKETDIGLFENWNSAFTTPDWEKTFSMNYPVASYSESENKIYLLATDGGNNSSIAVKVIDCENDFAETDTTITTSVALCSSRAREDFSHFRPAFLSILYLNGYIYSFNEARSAVMKIEAANPANVVEIPLNNAIDDGAWLLTDGTLLYVSHITGYSTSPVQIIGDDNVARIVTTSTGATSYIPIARRGVWLLGSTITAGQGVRPIGMTALSSYLATKYTLDSPVTKTADKTMKLSYSVRQV